MKRTTGRHARSALVDALANLEALPAAALAVDAREHLTYVNPMASTLLGYRADELAGQPLARFVSLPRPLRELAADPLRPYSVVLTGPLGEHVPTTLLFAPRHAGGAGDEGFVCLLQATSASLAGAEGLQHIERLVAMGQMVAGFAHEVRNPLAALKSVLENTLADSPTADPQLLEDLARMEKLVRRIENLVRSSLQFGRPSAPLPQPHDVGALVCTALEVVGPRVRAVHGAVRTEFERDLPPVFVDDNQIVQVMVVLLNNALDATQSPADVTVRARRGRRTDGAADAVLLEVADRGPGIAPELRARIFSPFFTTKPRGAGLGLSIARRLVRENRGQIEVRSTVGEGTAFVLELPVPSPP